ncbi:hypothetical protein PFICI_02518 [Pestalotiopsis fici W106-1]|uniref:Heterokaryon incompatibility domain-containing protein n=1 Tax=Pestalotiopsis fici (strain W106-1 / CGMCC3.15140) TaxID=1229662 RepID=W3XEG5_PESFW|nr:uncharacterized protein PFICI_02518 [Pestalotiopsis fici W106-1]ETS84493.1 hypothetical protein PFICI_02518 [Pestalotiopsis fici W106-1]
MRVIKASNLELKEFVGITPPYAILSHTWGEGEVTLQQYRDWRSAHAEYFTNDEGSGRDPSVAPVEIALLDINSMFRWYEEARTCYAYLSDVDKWTLGDGKLGNSRWFHWGWTLHKIWPRPNRKTGKMVRA